MRGAALALAGLLLGCASNPCVKPVISLPEPALPVVGATDLWCLTDDAYLRLAERDIALQSALRECRAVVDELTEQP